MKNQSLFLSFMRATKTTLFTYNKPRPHLVSHLSQPLHALIRSRTSNADANIYSCNRANSVFMRSGSLNSALKMFDEMPVRDVITWNIMISGLYRHGFSLQSLNLYKQMVCQGFIENSSTFSSVLSMCSNAGFHGVGLLVHSRAVVLGFTMNLYIGSTLVDLYVNMGLFDVGLRLLSTLPERSLATWNAVLHRVCETGRSKELYRVYNGMKLDGVEPNELTFCYLIQGCGYERFLDGGMQLHCSVMKKGLVDSNLFVANALVDFYSACGSLIEAEKSFEVILLEDVLSWNSMISVSASNGDMFYALELFHEMHLCGKKPSALSFLGFLKLSSGRKNIFLGKQAHCCLLKLGFDTVLVRSALIDMYGKCGDIESSVSIFDNVPQRSLECCNSLMTSLLRSGLIEDVIELFGLMVDNQIGYDEVSLSSIIKALSVSAYACSNSCTLLHGCATKSGFESDIAVSCSLIDAYSRSGDVKSSHEIFKQIPTPNVICFTSIISAFARNGLGMKCIEMLNTMIQSSVQPDEVTFLSVLMGCNHSGLVDEGRLIFHSMQAHHALSPGRQHYSCMVDLLGRAGLLDEAQKLLKDTPWEGDTVIWSSLLGSCRIYQNEQMGKRAAKMLMDIDSENPAGWLQASNFYSEIGDFKSSEQFREDAVATKMGREIGQSLIEVRDYG